MDIDEVVTILSEYGITPDSKIDSEDEIATGEIEEGDVVETVSLKHLVKIFTKENQRFDDNYFDELDYKNSVSENFFIEEGFLKECHELLESADKRTAERENYLNSLKGKVWDKDKHKPCAWYRSCHLRGVEMGIYIKQSCLPFLARRILLFADTAKATSIHSFSMRKKIARQFVYAAFLYLFLHEQFHHKVESLGFRALVATGKDKYSTYFQNVYEPTWWTDNCLEESLANSESYRRLAEPKYKKSLHPLVWSALRTYLATTMPFGPPGYRKGVDYFAEGPYRNGKFLQQSLVIEGINPVGRFSKVSPAPHHWSIAPNMIRGLFDISEQVFVIIPHGHSRVISHKAPPGFTTSTKGLVSALMKHHGFTKTAGGKGSHIKMIHPSGKIITVPGGRKDLSTGVLKSILSSIGNYPLNQLPKFLNGTI